MKEAAIRVATILREQGVEPFVEGFVSYLTFWFAHDQPYLVVLGSFGDRLRERCGEREDVLHKILN